MEGPLLVLKSWALTALVIWAYRRWWQRVAPPAPEFEAFCATGPVVGALIGLAGQEAHAAELVKRALGKRRSSIATLGGYPWPHYRLTLAVEATAGAVLLRVTGADVVRTRDSGLPALATLLRGVLTALPESSEAWLHPRAFDNGLSATPAGGFSVQRGTEKRPRLCRLELVPPAVR